MTKDHPLFDRQYRVFAGKFRRYHGESWVQRLFDIKTNLLNLRDTFFVVIGFFQSLVLLRRLQPDVTLLKGGFVGMPVGLAAAVWRLPFITHDSDAIPGLANRLVSRWAAWHATGTPVENYNYPKSKTRFVGVLVGQDYKYVTKDLMDTYRQELTIPQNSQVLLVTGGSLGAQPINQALVRAVPTLLKAHPGLYILHIVGQRHQDVYGTYTNKRLHVRPLVSDFYRYSGAADLIVTRAGANTLAEFGVQGKACIVVPNPFLTGGHQLKNTHILVNKKAVVMVEEASLTSGENVFLDTIERLLSQPAQRKALGQRLHALTPSDATVQLVDLLIATAEGRAGE